MDNITKGAIITFIGISLIYFAHSWLQSLLVFVLVLLGLCLMFAPDNYKGVWRVYLLERKIRKH